MGIYLPNMKMPESCCNCPLAKLSPTGENLFCNYTLSTVPWDDKPFDCPLTEVPPHGRLIDQKELMKRFCGHCDGYEECADKSMCSRAEECFDLKLIANTPTVIEAEECE